MAIESSLAALGRVLRAVLRAPRWRWPRRGLVALLAVLALWWAAVLVVSFPAQWLAKSEASSLIISDSEGKVLRQEANSAGHREHWMALDNISPHLIHATLASEDNDFWAHRGVDWLALGRASWLNLKGGQANYGGSTISMQLARRLAKTPRSLWGKLKQAVYAARLERLVSKEEILEQYLNRVYYGNGAWGAEQAAQLYFGKTAMELSVGEAALLAVFPRGPSFYNPFRHWQRSLKRRTHILSLMYKHGYIKKTDKDLALRVSIEVKRKRPHFKAPHFTEYVKTQLPKEFRTGANVQTTLDADLQQRLEIALAAHVDRLKSKNLTQAAVVVLRNSDGAILSMVGSRDYFDAEKNGAFNGATAILRPGSTLKPFVYGTAMEAGDSPATMAYDLALPEDAHQFYTKDVKSHGFARYREALASSYNLSAVHTLQKVGISPVLKKLRDAGLWTLNKADQDYDWGLAIGHAEVRLLDLTAAFSVFGRGGVAIKPRAIEKAKSVDGAIFKEEVEETRSIFSEEVAYQVFDMLSDPDARKPMFGDRVPMNLPFSVALKTGTTKAYTDLWAVGVTREYTVGVWGGNFDGSPTHQVMSLQGATPLMRAAYTAIASRFGQPTAPPRPSTMVEADICPLSGMRPGPHCEHRKSELFVIGKVPKESCDWHQEECGEARIGYPEVLRGWTQYYGLDQASACGEEEGDSEGILRIVAPVANAKFVLEAHRPSQNQRPTLAAYPAGSKVEWFIDGEPAEAWVPSAGTHVVKVVRGKDFAQVSIVYQ